ncbi:MAG: sugar phosphate nucleotidyltransferase [Myxococcota bacterium]
MRAMILAAGLGTRMQPLTHYRAKPALPIRGRPLISLLLEFLSRQDCHEVMINLHHRSDTIRKAVAADHPADLDIHWSQEPVPLGTGGGIRRAADFLAAEEACVVLASDMLLDVPLKALFDRHLASGRQATLLLREDPRTAIFGSIGVNSAGFVTRVGQRIIQCDRRSPLEGGQQETAHGLFTGVRFFSSEAFRDWPDNSKPTPMPSTMPVPQSEFAFEDLRDWLVPNIESRELKVGSEILAAEACVWEPVGTLEEYLEVNLHPPALPTLGGAVESWTGAVEVRGAKSNVIVSTEASLPHNARLERAVVWDGEIVPSNFSGASGVYAGGLFHEAAKKDLGAKP